MFTKDQMAGWVDNWMTGIAAHKKSDGIDWSLESLYDLGNLYNKIYPNLIGADKNKQFWALIKERIAARSTNDQAEMIRIILQIKSNFDYIMQKLGSVRDPVYHNYFPKNYDQLMSDLASLPSQLMPNSELLAMTAKVNEEEAKKRQEVERVQVQEKEQALKLQEEEKRKKEHQEEATLKALANNLVATEMASIKGSISPHVTLDIRMNSAERALKDLITHRDLRHPHSLEALGSIYAQIKSDDFNYLRRNRNFLRQLTGTYAQDHSWSLVIAELKSGVIAVLDTKTKHNKLISNDDWKLAEKIINEKATSTPFLFKDPYRERFQELRRLYYENHPEQKPSHRDLKA